MDESESKIHPKPTALPSALATATAGGTSRARSARRRGAVQEQRFSSYLAFGVTTTACMVVFLIVYGLTLVILSPLLFQEAPTASHMKRGDVLKPVLHSAVENVKRLKKVRSPSQLIGEGVVGAIKHKFDQFKHHKGVTDAELLQKAVEESQALRKQKQQAYQRLNQNPVVDHAAIRGGGGGGRADLEVHGAPGTAKKKSSSSKKRTGFIVLGMHRSGTSMLSGLLATGMGYQTGGPLIGGAFDNVKGFFERIDVVLQNDEFMNVQNVYWNMNIPAYDTQKALQAKQDGTVTFQEGTKALQFLNDPQNSPWLQKDPRMCITLKTWLPLLAEEPAVLFTYRHPLEVAQSLKKREKDFSIERGLRLWILYNIRAIQNSRGLCVVYSSNDAVLNHPLEEVQRISDELTSKCNLPPPPRKLEKDDVDRFVDPNLEHNRVARDGPGDQQQEEIADYDGCSVKSYPTSTKPDSDGWKRERDLYLKAMRMYCDFQGGKAYQEGYEFPDMTP